MMIDMKEAQVDAQSKKMQLQRLEADYDEEKHLLVSKVHSIED